MSDPLDKVLYQSYLLAGMKFVVANPDFIATSTHPSWLGKVQCRYCTVKGWPGSVATNHMWWGKNHGETCRKKP